LKTGSRRRNVIKEDLVAEELVDEDNAEDKAATAAGVM